MPRIDQSVALARAAISNANRPGHRGGHAPGSWIGGWVVVGLLVASAPSFAQPVECVPVEVGINGGTAVGSEVRDRLAFVANAETGLLVLDVTDPANPVRVTQLDLPGRAQTVDLFDSDEGPLAYVACTQDVHERGGGVYVVDIADPAAPSLLGVVGQPWSAFDARVYTGRINGPHLYVCEGAGGLSIYDLSRDAREPLTVARFDGGGSAADVDFMRVDRQDIAIVAGFQAGVHFVDVTDQDDPVLLYTAPEPERSMAVQVSFRRVYVAAQGDTPTGWDERFWAYDVLDPSAPRLVGSFALESWPSDVDVKRRVGAGDLVYVAEGYGGLGIFEEVSDGVYERLATVAEDTTAWDVHLDGDLAYVSGIDGGMTVLDVANPSVPVEVGAFTQLGRVRGVFARGGEDHVYVSGMGVVDVTNKADPRLIGYPDGAQPVSAWDVAFRGDLAVASGSRGIYTIDLTDPLAPRVLATAPPSSGGHAAGVAIDGNVAYLCGPDDDFEVLSFLRSYDISDPAAPVVLDEIETVASGYDVDAADGMVYYANGSLDIVDASDPMDLAVVFSQRPAFVTDAVARDGVLYAIDSTVGLRIEDVTDPANPLRLGTLGGFSPRGTLVLSGDRAFIADANSGVVIVDIQDPTDPRLITMVDTPSEPTGVAVDGRWMYVALNSDGLRVYDLGPCDPCAVDLDGDGEATLFDYLAFGGLFALGDLAADFDGDGDLTIFDFLAFQNAFDIGCG